MMNSGSVRRLAALLLGAALVLTALAGCGKDVNPPVMGPENPGDSEGITPGGEGSAPDTEDPGPAVYSSEGLEYTRQSDGTYWVFSYSHHADLQPAYVEIPAIYEGAAVTGIGEKAFQNDAKLVSIRIPASVAQIADLAFSGCTRLTDFVVDPENTVYHSAGGCLIETASRTLVAGCKGSVIPDDGSVTRIGMYAFVDCTTLAAIAIPENVTSVEEGAFFGCTSLSEVEVSPSVEAIGNFVFCECTSLTQVRFVGESRLTSIGKYAFFGCTGLADVTIPASVQCISPRAFWNCTGLARVRFDGAGKWQQNYNPVDVSVPETNAENLTGQYCASEWEHSA